MILAEKISMLRKKAGWSQEELAEQLNVTRQSVSKWEGAQSVPDIDNLLQISRLFQVSTDFLLKDELETDETAPAQTTNTDDKPLLRRVTMEEAGEYLELSKKAAPKRALGTFLCIISPIVLLLLAAMSEVSAFGIPEDAAGGIGAIVVLCFVAAGVLQFLSSSTGREYEFLEKEAFETEYGVAGMVKECRKQYQAKHSRFCKIGTMLCILAAIPIFVVAIFSGTPAEDLIGAGAIAVLLLLVGFGAGIFVYSGTYQDAMDCLLEEGDYTRRRKVQRNIKGPVSLIYWLAVTAIYIYFTFGPDGNGQARYTWYIWAIAGVLFGAVLAVVSLIQYLQRER